MARSQTVLRVFVASPGDVADERNTLEDVINELNVTWSKTMGVLLELVRWETHTFPGLGTDVQAVINEQLGDDYDIFIGIMWARFGTATGRAGSGTAEEFYRAYRLHQQHPTLIRIMFYFKDVAIPPSDMDPSQLASMKEFQKELGEKGTYYWTYTDRDEFAQLVRMHLGHQVQGFGKSWGMKQAETLTPSKTEPVSLAPDDLAHNEEQDADDEEGYLDLFLTGGESFEQMLEAMTRMTSTLQGLGNRVRERSEELNRAKDVNGNVDLKQAKRISNLIAEEMNSFAASMEVDVPVFGNSLSIAIDAYTRAFTLTKELGVEKKEDVKTLTESIHQFNATLTQTQKDMASLRETVATAPRATTQLNRAKKRTVSILDRLDEEFTKASNLSSEMEKLLDQF